MIGGRHRSNTELIAQGLANIASGLFGGIPATGAIARTATNVKNGGRTPVAGIVHAITLLLIMLFLGKWAKLIPLSCLAGILMVVAYNMSEYSSFFGILKGSRYDILVLLSTFFLTVLVDLTVAIQIGMVLAAFLFMKRMSDVGEAKPLTSYPENDIDDASMISLKLPENVKVFEISGPLFFGVANRFNDILNNISDHSTVIVIRMRNVPMIDATGIHNFRTLITKFLHQKKAVVLSGISPLVLKELERSRIVELTGAKNIYNTFEEALVKARELAEETNTRHHKAGTR
jgi:SulP family sulfate permease